jgi:hypothetical protein
VYLSRNGLIPSGPASSTSSVVVVIVHSEDCDLLTGWGRTGMTLLSGIYTVGRKMY